jgi:glycosyltransferase involved in cell wall biosynthesis
VYITPRPPYPLTSGMAIRQYYLLRAYAESGRVHLVSFYNDDAQRTAAERLNDECERVDFVSTRTMAGRTYARTSIVRRVQARLRGHLPSELAWWHSEEMTHLVREASATADIVHVARLPMVSQVQPLLRQRGPRPAMILDLDDVESSAGLRRLRHDPPASPLARMFGYYDLARIWAYEKRVTRRFDRVFVCSERDRQRFRHSSVVVVPNGTSVPASLPVRRPEPRTIIFCGLLSYAPNIDAVRFLSRSIIPEIQRSVPDVRVLVVGRAPTAEIQALHDGKTVVVASDVPSVVEYYAKSAVAVVPLRFGGGTRIKILEAWALGVPVVSTSIGCEGLDAVHGEHLMVADDAKEFAARCVSLLRASDQCARLTTAGWQLVSERYRWDAIGRRAVADVATLPKRPRCRPARHGSATN